MTSEMVSYIAKTKFQINITFPVDFRKILYLPMKMSPTNKYNAYCKSRVQGQDEHTSYKHHVAFVPTFITGLPKPSCQL